MDYALVCTVSLLVAALTLYSGFGLGTLLMPAFAVFFPPEVAIAATAVVHLLNNIFKVALVGRSASWPVTVRFGAPAIVAAFAGAALLAALAGLPAIATYRAGPVTASVSAVKIVLGVLLACFALLELSPRFRSTSVPAGWLPLGGALSGFFGGLTGMQGALRAAFLARANLDTRQFIGTTAVVSTAVDLSRLAMYAIGLGALTPHRESPWRAIREHETLGLVVAASAAAFLGTLLGARLVKKVTIASIQRLVAGMLVVMSFLLIAGLI